MFEKGSHEELMAKGESGIYYHLVNNQVINHWEYVATQYQGLKGLIKCFCN